MNIVIIGLLGLGFMGAGLIARLGYMKALYLAQGVSVFVPGVMKYTFLPFGITLIVMELSLSEFVPVEYRDFIFRCIFGSMLLSTIVLAMWQPNWLLPYWLRYLRQTYGYAGAEFLLSKARYDPSWFKKVRTHEGLVAWAEETIAQSRFSPPPDDLIES